jgi:hypothetical protein
LEYPNPTIIKKTNIHPTPVGHIFYNTSHKDYLLLSHPLLSHNFKFFDSKCLEIGCENIQYFQNKKYSYAWGL